MHVVFVVAVVMPSSGRVAEHQTLMENEDAFVHGTKAPSQAIGEGSG
jgi:hypothetical protein